MNRLMILVTSNYGLSTIVKLVCIAVSTIVAVRLLMKAPTKDYAHDLF